MGRLLTIFVALVLVFLSGCEREAQQPAAPTVKVEVSQAGEKFDPPIDVSAIPDGAWYCDMGTAHYARSEEGDGVCPLCKMKLKKAGEK